MSLSWSAPASDGGSSIVDYLIQYSSGGATTTFSHTPSTATSTTVTGLTANTSYLFSVSAINSAGTSTPVTLTATTDSEDTATSTATTSKPIVAPIVSNSISSSGGYYMVKSPATIKNTSNTVNPINNTIFVKFTRSLTVGNTGDDVKRLQVFLNKNRFTINTKKGGIGSLGHETKTFGVKTSLALIRFQKKYKLYPANGTLNKATKNYLNSLYSKEKF